MTKLPTPPPEPTDDTSSEEWIEGFEAACDWNADKRLRLECVQTGFIPFEHVCSERS